MPTGKTEIVNRGFTTEVWLNRPDKYNALDLDMINDLNSVFSSPAPSGKGYVVIRGRGEAFCSGADLNLFIDNPEDFAEGFSKLLRLIYEYPLPVIAITHGSNYGGGLGILAAADIVIADVGAKFCFSEVKLGIVPALIAPYVALKMGPGAMRLPMLSAKVFSVADALQWGLVHETIDMSLEGELERLHSVLEQNKAMALQITKTMLLNIENTNDLAQNQKYVKGLFMDVVTSDWARRGIQSFLSRKKSQYR